MNEKAIDSIVKAYNIAKHWRYFCEANDDLFSDFIHLEIVDDMEEIMKYLRDAFQRLNGFKKDDEKS